MIQSFAGNYARKPDVCFYLDIDTNPEKVSKDQAVQICIYRI